MAGNPGKKDIHKRFELALVILLVVNYALFNIAGFPGSISSIIGESTGTSIPDMCLCCNASDLINFLTVVGSEGRTAFQCMHLGIDLTFPLLYGFLFYAIIHHLTGQLGWHRKYIPFFGFIPMVFDFLENFSLMVITGQYPSCPETLTGFVQIFTLCKFINLLLVVCFIILMLVKSGRLNRKNTE